MELTETVLKRMKRPIPPKDEERIRHNLAVYAFQAGDYDKVVAAGRAMHKLAVANGGEQSWPAACALQVMADGLNAEEQYAKARPLAEQAVAIAKKVVPPHIVATQLYCTLADACAGLGDTAAVEAAAKECLDLCRAAYGDDDDATREARTYFEKLTSGNA